MIFANDSDVYFVYVDCTYILIHIKHYAFFNTTINVRQYYY